MFKRIIIAILLVLFGTQAIWAGVIEAKELKRCTKENENLVIISARNPDDYAKKHIDGAINLYHKELYRADGVDAMLKPAEEIAEILSVKGISPDSKIVIYDDGENKLAGRIYWILDYIGAKDVSILNGHLKSWAKIRGKVSKNPVSIESTEFTAALKNSVYASMDYVKANKDKAGILLVDVRSQEEYDGKNEDEKLSRKGHIPGAIHFEYKNVLNDNGTLKIAEELSKVFNSAGITKDKEIILYCATSVRAGIVYMTLKSIMKFPNVRVYDGAFYEWESFTDNPVE